MEKREVTYSLTKNEYVTMSFLQTFRSWYGLIVLVLFLLLLIICSMGHVWYVSLLYIILFPFLRLYRLDRSYKKKFGKQSITISIGPEGFGVSGEGLESTIAWKYFKSCNENSKYIFFRLQRAQNVFVIPKRAFSSETDATAFFHDLQSYGFKG